MKRGMVVLAMAAMTAVPVAAPVSAGAGDPAGWYRVSFEDRLTQEDRDALSRAGASDLQYLPVHAYCAWLPSPGAVRRLPGVASVRPLSAAERIDPSLPTSGPAPVLIGLRALAEGVSVAALARLGDVLSVEDADPAGEARHVVMRVPAGLIPSIAARSEVAHVGPASPGLVPEDEASDQITAGNLSGATPTAGYETWLASHGLDGSGVRVSIVDTGVDANHPDLAGRVVAKVEYSMLPTGEPLDSGGHGTHVAGIVGGAGAALPGIGRVRDGSGFVYGLGMAPKVELIDQNEIATTRSSHPPAGGWQRISRDAVRNGAVAWNASWHSGEGTGIGYNQSARTMDIMVRDADWERPGTEPLTLVFSAGNGSGTQGNNATSTITAPKEAKNMITVANSLSHRAGNIDTLSASSSRGPARDGRILPTVAAPGSSIVSARALNPATSCNTPTTDGYGLYASCSGTSMAAPHVTGAVALLTQWWRKANDGADPSPAMSKALLINTATDMAAADIPNKNEGWGRVNLGRLLDRSARRIYVDQSHVFEDLDERFTLPIRVVDPSQPLKATLVWTDAPGAGLGGTSIALVNDLDLTLTSGDGAVIYRGNWFSQGASVPGGASDRRNNLENVFVRQPAGSYTLEISVANLPGDGVPQSGDGTDQDFALVISNAEIEVTTQG